MSVKRRDTQQKRLISKVVEGAGRPLSPREVHARAGQELPKVSLGTVYRSLKALQEEKRVVAVAVPGGSDRYEARSCADHHHHHFHCDSCDRLFDIPGCGLHVDRGLPTGFSIARHEVVLYGRCVECNRRDV